MGLWSGDVLEQGCAIVSPEGVVAGCHMFHPAYLLILPILYVCRKTNKRHVWWNVGAQIPSSQFMLYLAFMNMPCNSEVGSSASGYVTSSPGEVD